MNISEILGGNAGDHGEHVGQPTLGKMCCCEFWFRPWERGKADQFGATFREVCVVSIHAEDDGLHVYTRDASPRSNQEPHSDGYIGKFIQKEGKCSRWIGFFVDAAVAEAAAAEFIQKWIGGLYELLATVKNS